MHEKDGLAREGSSRQASRTAEEYHLLIERKMSLLSLKRSGTITSQESDELLRLEGLSRDYTSGVISMFKDLLTGEGGRSYDLRDSRDRTELSEKLRSFREGPRLAVDIGAVPLPPQVIPKTN